MLFDIFTFVDINKNNYFYFLQTTSNNLLSGYKATFLSLALPNDYMHKMKTCKKMYYYETQFNIMRCLCIIGKLFLR